MQDETPWHLNKSIPLSFILAIVGQTLALVWFVSSLNSAIDSNTRDLMRHDARLNALDKIVQSQAVTMGRIDENIKSIRQMMETSRGK